MKNKLLLILILICYSITTTVAQTYNNEWIDYSQTYFKIKTSKTGLHKVPYAALSNSGINLTGSNFVLYYKGQEVPIYPTTNNVFGTNDYFEFYGEKNDGSFDTQLYPDPKWQLHTEYSLFTDTATYFLTSKPGEHLRYTQANNDISDPLPAETHFTHTIKNYYSNIYFGGNPFRNLGGVSNYFADFEEGEGFVGDAIIENASKTIKIFTKSVYPNNDNAIIKVGLVGQSDDPTNIPDHHTKITINNSQFADTIFEGNVSVLFDFTTPANTLADSTLINIKSMADISSVDKCSVSFLNISYPHTYSFDNSAMFKFTIANDGDKYFEITNFSGGSTPILYDLTNKLRITPVTTGAGINAIHKFKLESVAGGGDKRTLVFINTTLSTVTTTVSNIFPIQFVNYLSPENQGNYIILSHPFLMQGDTNYVEAYKQYRRSAEGGGYTATIINIEQLYDQFSFGIAKHPQAIRNFTNYVVNKWNAKPKFLFIIGKAVEYYRMRSSAATQFQECLVPTYGFAPSDVMLSSHDVFSFVPQLATGRIPARTKQDVRAYLEKIKLYDATSKLPCTREARNWTKGGVFMAGGNNVNEANLFLSHLNGYMKQYKDSSLAGNVVATYTKTNEEIVDYPNLDNQINNGLQLIHFVGHSSSQYWDIGLSPPWSYQNTGKYPLIISSSCFVGNIHGIVNANSPPSMSADYVLADKLGSIGFLAGSHIGFPTYMNIYCHELYDQFVKDSYRMELGIIMQKINSILSDSLGASGGVKLMCQEYTLAGDPAIKIGFWDNPELLIENNALHNDISFIPTNLTANLDSFAVQIILTNVGKATNDSIDVKLERTLPNNTVQTFIKRFPPVLNADTLLIYIPMGVATKASGENKFEVSIDYLNKINEDCEDNNSLVINKFIFSDLLVPISPCNYSVVGSNPLTLYASTGQPLLAALSYRIQIDTTILFNSSLKKETIINSASGVITWTPDMAWTNGTVYYWRTSQIPSDNVSYNWQQSSFLYNTTLQPGWNQSHYYQFTNDSFNNLTLDSISRHFDFKTYNNVVKAYNNYSSYGEISFQLNYIGLGVNTCLKGDCGGGIVVAAFKPTPILEPLVSYKDTVNTNSCGGFSNYGSIQCGNGDTRNGVEYYTGSTQQAESLVNFLQNEIPNGYYVLMYSIKNHRLGTTDSNEPIYSYLPTIRSFLHGMGIFGLDTINNNTAFIAFGRKNEPNYTPILKFSTSETETIELEANVGGRAKSGTIESPLIGPAHQWKQLRSSFGEVEPNDLVSINVYGVDNNATETLMLTAPAQQVTNLQTINAQQYPYIKLKAVVKDSISYTPAQLKYWQVLHDKAAEAALNSHVAFEFNSDTLQEGQPVSLSIAVTNASPVALDSLLVKYTITDKNNIEHVYYVKQAPIGAWQTITTNFAQSTEGFAGTNLLQVELNPNKNQLEKFKFNNLLNLPFFVLNDKINPYIDVTFDGVHILNNDLVSAKPKILIQLKDDNKFLPLNDTSKFELILQYPNASTQNIHFNNPNLVFTPATSQNASQGKNQAYIAFNPTFTENGNYILTIKARDKSNNLFAGKNYVIGFTIETKPMISNLLNYPNPFTSNTKFVFTLTGSQVPQDVTISIYTISGKIVRQITQTELGNIRIGKNISEFTWNGTDQFGNQLANGVYLYKVSAKLNGQKLEHYSNKTVDAYFKNEFGKMYLIR